LVKKIPRGKGEEGDGENEEHQRHGPVREAQVTLFYRKWRKKATELAGIGFSAVRLPQVLTTDLSR
jgi:hypothetical protein